MQKHAAFDLLMALHDFYIECKVPQKEKKTCWIAYSGGLDSHVLLLLFHQLRLLFPLKLNVIHINHQLSPNAKKWSQHCQTICENLDIQYIEKTVNLEIKTGDSLEAKAREKRYAIFAACLNEGDILFTAHHQDDQAETLLLQLLRGAGPKGLSAMPKLKKFGKGFHARPLLNIPRIVLQQFAEKQVLEWIEDETNQNQNLTRNFIRHQIIPVLQTRLPSINETLSRVASHCADTTKLLEEYIETDYQAVKGSKENTLSISKLLTFSQERQRMILRRFIEHHHYPLPNTAKLKTIQQALLTAKEDRFPKVSWLDVELRRYRDDLYAMRSLSKITLGHKASFHWHLSQPFFIEGLGVLKARLNAQGQLDSGIQEVKLGFRQGGEIIHLAKRGRHTLKNLFQEYAIPPWERDRIPLLFFEQTLISMVGYCVSADYLCSHQEVGWEISLEKAD